ncbi:MAG TPA: D-glycero-beta-D-manno-heptose 1-phosphate adenylyltransferase [Candidatus Kapabacteria bacterium]|nr:D-glycero-beta-D-manno-heptose 1-phosphate adenylyltransferase [Candidatus Kapabacteria bacterium]HPO61871.1 D-glycero-beta-D-manno-heptose 1-phosphate adenylyltransferase [Candidatus Kapabacteria bacterium]
MLLNRKTIAKLADELKKNGKKLVFTNGCFDIIHSGHIKYLTEARKLGDYLIVGLNSDSSVKMLKGDDRPINGEEDRAAVLCGLNAVDFVTIFEEETPAELIREIIPNVLVKGGDYTVETVVGADTVENNGGNVIIIPFVEGKSTTRIINKMK